jgi:hypothetical protein
MDSAFLRNPTDTILSVWAAQIIRHYKLQQPETPPVKVSVFWMTHANWVGPDCHVLAAVALCHHRHCAVNWHVHLDSVRPERRTSRVLFFGPGLISAKPTSRHWFQVHYKSLNVFSACLSQTMDRRTAVNAISFCQMLTLHCVLWPHFSVNTRNGSNRHQLKPFLVLLNKKRLLAIYILYVTSNLLSDSVYSV